MQPRSRSPIRRVTKTARGSPNVSARSDGSRGGGSPRKRASSVARARPRSSRRPSSESVTEPAFTGPVASGRPTGKRSAPSRARPAGRRGSVWPRGPRRSGRSRRPTARGSAEDHRRLPSRPRRARSCRPRWRDLRPRRRKSLEKGTSPFCAKHPKGRSGKRGLSPFSHPKQKHFLPGAPRHRDGGRGSVA